MNGSFVLRGARVYRHGGDTDMPPVRDVLVRDGKIAEEQDFMDNLDFMQQLGIISKQ